jgi:hypothetical protein
VAVVRADRVVSFDFSDEVVEDLEDSDRGLGFLLAPGHFSCLRRLTQSTASRMTMARKRAEKRPRKAMLRGEAKSGGLAVCSSTMASGSLWAMKISLEITDFLGLRCSLQKSLSSQQNSAECSATWRDSLVALLMALEKKERKRNEIAEGNY